MLDSLIGLQEKASSFFKDYSQKYGGQMKCTSGCDHCCIGGLSIFTWEAELIIHWFSELSKIEQDRVCQKWQCEENTDFTDVTGKQSSLCSFLSEGNCSIYSRRPIICRTQGMGLKWSESGVVKRDCCPLNFVDADIDANSAGTQSKEEDELNLDTLNQMMAQAQLIFSKQMNSSLAPAQIQQQRVPLIDLKDFFLAENKV